MNDDTIKTSKQYGGWLATLNAKQIAEAEYYSALGAYIKTSEAKARVGAALAVYQEAAKTETEAKKALWI